MKPRNFPERKRQRQLRAIARQIGDDRESGRVSHLMSQEQALMVTGSQRHVRTKKDRSHRAKLSR